MTHVVILFGTESGNSELVAEDIAEELASAAEVDVVDMTDFELDDFDTSNFYIVVCSTHGDGELPSGARPFHVALEAESPSLEGIRYAVFGLGDSSYDTYSHGSEIIDEKLTELGATRVGVYGRHDASDGSLANDPAVEWSKSLVELF
jgi:MioC protein